ncbi:MAG: glycerate kinase [Candidatus Omnitrophica bacterium]|nr:glycerate kinase [Candidatus Omnitrophota bacterium]
MKIVIAPASYKGSITNIEASEVMKKASKKVFPSAELVVFPLADGGEGTIDVVKMLTGGRFFFEDVSDPVGRKRRCKWLKKGDTAYIEMAQASGLTLLKESERNPLKTTTYGTGELIKSAVLSGCNKIFIGAGGSATNDGGIGALTALGIKFFDRKGKVIYPGRGEDLIKIKEIEISGMMPELGRCKFTVLSDVYNPLYGREGAAYVYAPQKGASEKDVKVLDEGLRNYNEIVKKITGVDINGIKGSGAAGGIAGSFVAFLGAEIISGIKTILEMGAFEEKLKGADLLLTGEGRVDIQTFYGKSIGVVSDICRRYNVPVVILAGSVDISICRNKALKNAIILSVSPCAMSIEEVMKKGKTYLFHITEQVLKIYRYAGKS